MNWQLVQNVDPPFDRLLLLSFPDDNGCDDASFAVRRKDGYMYFGGSPYDALNGKGEKIEYSTLKDGDPYNCPTFWTTFVWP